MGKPDQQQQALTMLAKALEMEKNGFAYYEKAARQCRNRLGKKMFEMLRDDEIIHSRRIRLIYTSIKDDAGWNEEWKTIVSRDEDMTTFFGNLSEVGDDEDEISVSDLDALGVGIELESRAIHFYEAHLAEARITLEMEFLQAMIEEEQGHLKALSDMRRYLENPGEWLS